MMIGRRIKRLRLSVTLALRCHLNISDVAAAFLAARLGTPPRDALVGSEISLNVKLLADGLAFFKGGLEADAILLIFSWVV
jgi:hypothetical protein